MTEDIAVAAWEAFSREPGESIKKASVREQLDTIAAQVNELKINSERSAQLIPGLMADANAIGQSNAAAAESPMGGAAPGGAPGGMPMPGAEEMPGMEEGGAEGMAEEGAPEEGMTGEESGMEGDTPEEEEDEEIFDAELFELMREDESEEGVSEGTESTPEGMTEGAPEGMVADEGVSEGSDDVFNNEYFTVNLPEEMPTGQTDGAMGLSTPGENISTAFDAFIEQAFSAVSRAEESGNDNLVQSIVTAVSEMERIFTEQVAPLLDSNEQTDAVASSGVASAVESPAGGSGIGIAKSADLLQLPKPPGTTATPSATPTADKADKAIAKDFASAVGEKPDKSDKLDSAIAKGKRMTTISSESVKKSAAVQRPSAASSMNGDFTRPNLADAIPKPKTFAEMMADVKSGKRPRDAVAGDLEQYRMIHGRSRP